MASFIREIFRKFFAAMFELRLVPISGSEMGRESRPKPRLTQSFVDLDPNISNTLLGIINFWKYIYDFGKKKSARC